MGIHKERENRRRNFVYVPSKGTQIHTAPIREDIRGTDAYKSLSITGRLILFDMIASHCKATSWETRSGKFTYTWKKCRESIGETAFNKARREILMAGFFETLPEDQSGEPGAPTWYRASARWITFQAPPEQEAKWARKAACKQSRISRQIQRRNGFRVSLQAKKPTTKGVVAHGNHHHEKRGSGQNNHHKRCGDGCLQNGRERPQKACGNDSTIASSPVDALKAAENPDLISERPGLRGGAPECVGDILPLLTDAYPRSGRQEFLRRVQQATGDSDDFIRWWGEVWDALSDAGKTELECELHYVEMCADPVQRHSKDLGELREPGAFLASKIRAWARVNNVTLPSLPYGDLVNV